MRNALALLVGALALSACADDGDHAAPDTQIDVQPDALTNKKATLQFHALGNFSQFLCSFDGEAPAPCISPVERDLADGDHTFTVAATLLDAIDLTPAVAQWKLDTVAPETTLGAVPPNPDNNATPSIAFTGTDDQGTVTFECSVDGAAPSPCTSPFGVAVADGDHAFTVAAIDAAGNHDATPATYGWNVNTTAPQTAIITGPADASTTAADVSFTFSSPDASATFECAIDGGAFAACTSPRALTLADGGHTFAVRAVGIAGPDPSPASVTWTVDAIAPTTTITVKPADPSNDTTPAFQFTASETATFECQVDGLTTFAPCTVPFEAPSLADGSQTFRVRATDGVGNVGAAATFTWVVDTAAPTVAITSEPPANTNDNTPTVTFTAAGNPALIECAVDGGSFAACTSAFTAGAVGDGPHTITVRVTDAAGNTSTATTGTFTVDTVIPTVSIDVEPTATSNDTTPTIQFSTTDNPTVVQCKVDNGAFAACTSPFTSGVLAQGTHTITVRVADAAGNASTDVTAPFVIDTTPPTVVINTQPAALSNNATATVTFTTGGSPTQIECQLDAGTFAACTSPFSTTVTEGTHTITVRVTDAATNTASATTTPFQVDLTPPTVTIDAEPLALSNDVTPTIAFTTAGNPTSTQCRVDAGAFANCTSPFTTTVTEGTHTITVRVTDAATNTSSATTSPFVVDVTAPTVTLTAEPLALSNDTTPTVTFTTAGNPTATECQLDAGAFATCTSPFTTTVTEGTHTITVRVTDGAANSSSKTTAAFVVDITPPTVTINGEPLALSNDATPTVQFTTAGSPTKTECQVDAGAFANCTSPFTTTVADGTHTITVRVTDAATNTSSATTSPFTVDLIPPTVTITAEPPALSNDNTPTVTFTTAGSPTKIECRVDAGTFAACTSPFTTSVADGAHTITVRVTDAATNTGSATTASFTVDTSAPAVSLTSQPAALSNDSTPTVTFTTAGGPTAIECQLDAGAFAACTSPFTTSVVDGTHTITVRVTDAATNSSSATTSPFKVDTITPTVTLTVEPSPNSNDNTPTVQFTTTDNPSSIQCQVDAGVFASCTSPFTSTALADGTHTITVRVSDGVNTSSKTTSPFVIDTAAPAVSITSQPAALSNDSTPTVTFTTTGGPTAIECQVDAGAFAACTSPFTTAVADGAHTITVRVTDAATNSSSATTSSFTVDTVAPTVTITSEPLAVSNDTTPTVVFTTAGSPTSTQCQVDTGAFANCTSPFTTTVAEGNHTITIKVTDAATNSSTKSTAQFTVDVTAPTITIVSQPLALSNDNTPTVTFTTAGSPTVTECQVDTGAFTSCTGGSFTPTVADGTHTLTIHVKDAATNESFASTSSFTVDTVKPVVTFDDAPPAQWPVNYFDMKFHASETATFRCSLNGGAFSACTSPFTITTTYNVASSFTVQATDAANNTGTATTSWTSSDGLVLHYAYEQGGTDNSSLLAQNAAYSPDGDIATVPFVGGWAGTAAGPSMPKQTFLNTKRPLSSAAIADSGTASFWIRPISDIDSGTVISNLGATGGFRVRLQGTAVIVEVLQNGQLFSASSSVGFQKWTQVAVRATGPAKGLELWINGNQVGTALPPTATGFDSAQAADLTVGQFVFADIDDIRFFNKPLTSEEMCTTLARGSRNANGGCVSLSPGFELDYESDTVLDTGAWDLPLSPPQLVGFVDGTKTAGSMFLKENFGWGYGSGFKANVNAVAGHSFSFWFTAGAVTSDIIDFRATCNANFGFVCGMVVNYDGAGSKLNLFAGTITGIQQTVSIGVSSGRHGIVVTEQRDAANTKTVSITVYVDAKVAAVIPIGSGNVFSDVNDVVTLVPRANLVTDELEFWTKDLSSSDEILCENGFDGLFVPADGSCLLTSN